MPFERVVGKRAHCRALGVPVDASLEQIKAAYRKEALRNHPDKNPSSNAVAAAERFVRVKAAYDYLLKVRSADDAKTATSKGNTSKSTSTSSTSFSTFSTVPPNGQPPIRHDLLLTLEEYLHGTVKKLLISPPPNSTQQQKKLLEVRVQAGATPGTVLYGRILSIGILTLSEKVEDRSIAVVLGDRPNQKFSRYPGPDSPNLKYVYEVTEEEVRRAVAKNISSSSYGRSIISLVLTIPTLSADAATPETLILYSISDNQARYTELQMLPKYGLPLGPGSAQRGYLRVDLKTPPGHTFASLIAAATTTTPPPAPEPPSTPFRNSTNQTQQQQQKTPSKAAKAKVTKQPLRRSERILKRNQQAPPPPPPPS